MTFHFINHYCGTVFQDQEYCSQSSCLQSFSTLEKSCRFNSSYARSILNIHENFTVAFLKNNNTVRHVPWEFSRVSVGSYFCRRVAVASSVVVPCVYIFRGKQKHLEKLIVLLAELRKRKSHKTT